MTEIDSSLIVRGENVQTMYNNYVSGGFAVNRKYQRKLVWSVAEKSAFMDSLAQQLPVPLILTAEKTMNGHTVLEIIDGLQRLHAIVSFIENQFPLDGKFFDLDALAETKLRRDQGDLDQRTPVLDRATCVHIANYVLPMSTYRAPSETLIEEIFRRINSNGRFLSRQEIRQAGSISNFADLVREVSSFVRGDTSVSTLIKLEQMSSISVTTDPNGPGVYIEDVFWVQNKILERDQVRESRDEEIIADIIATMILDSTPSYRSETLDTYYGLSFSETREKKSDRVESAVQRETPELIKRRFEYVHGELESILRASGKNFAKLIFRNPRQRIPRYYSTVFLALYEVLIKKDRVIQDYAKMANALEGAGDRVLNISGGGGTWSKENKRDNVDNVIGNIERHTVPANGARDVMLEANESRIYRLLKSAEAEHALFELKQGLHVLNADAHFDGELFERILQTITAIANDSPSATGYVLLGVADKQEDAKRVKDLYGISMEKEQGFYLTGIDHEFAHHGGSLDGYQHFLSEKVRNSDLDPSIRSQILREMRPARYNGRMVLLLPVQASDYPVSFKDKWFERQGDSTVEVPAREVSRLFKRFSRS